MTTGTSAIIDNMATTSTKNIHQSVVFKRALVINTRSFVLVNSGEHIKGSTKSSKAKREEVDEKKFCIEVAQGSGVA